MASALTWEQANMENTEASGVKAEMPLDNPDEFHMDKELNQQLKTESQLLCNYAKRGLIQDFPILHC